MMIIDTLKTSIANHFEAALTVHGYHINVEGIDFKQYHDFFQEIYTDFYAQVDESKNRAKILYLNSQNHK